MNRRSFLKAGVAIGAAALVPSLLIEPAKRRTINLKRFCGKSWESRKWEMTLPFQQGERTYATNGRVCVKVEPMAGDIVQAEKQIPPASALPYWDHAKQTGWKRLPESPRIIVAKDYCLGCYGFGTEGGDLGEECKRCEGLGCKACHGIGFLGPLCPQSHGNALDVVRPSIVVLGDSFYDVAYWRNLRTLGTVEFVNGSNDTTPMRFAFEEGHGLLMPLERELTLQRIAKSA